MKKNINISVAKIGMNRDASRDSLQKQHYTFAMNVNVENESGDLVKLKSEHSNILASKLKSGFRVLGLGTNTLTLDTYFLLTNPTTKVSEFGIIKDNSSYQDAVYTNKPCIDCNEANILPIPLEDTTQPESQIYETLLTDGCNDEYSLCLNLNIDYPIKRLVIKNEKGGVKVFFSDNYNPPRYIDLSRLEWYQSTGTFICEEDNTTPVCLNCDKLRIFPLYTPLQIKPESLTLGGNTLLGQYSFYGAYADVLGNELSEYTSLTNPVSVFDSNNKIRVASEAAERTPYAIKLKVNNLDPKFSYYKIVVSHTNVIDSGVRNFVVGVFPATNDEVIFTSETGKAEISLAEILIPRSNIELVGGLATANNYLFGYGVSYTKEWNLQPVVNLLGGFLKWQTHISSEDLYENGVIGSLYKGYPRDEVVPFAIQFTTNTGYRTARFPFIASPPTDTDLEVVLGDDVDSLNTSELCNTPSKSSRWEVYNTAKEIGRCPTGPEIKTSTSVENVTRSCVSPEANESLNETFSINDIEEFTTLEAFINNNKSCVSRYPFCDATKTTNNPDECTIEFNNIEVRAGGFSIGNTYIISEVGTTDFLAVGATAVTVGTTFVATGAGKGTGAATLQNCGNPLLVEEYMEVNTILGEVITKIGSDFPTEYIRLKPSSNCNMFARDDAGDKMKDNSVDAVNGFMEDYIESGGSQNVYFRESPSGNTSVLYSDNLRVQEDATAPLGQSYYLNYLGGGLTTDSITRPSFITTAVSANFQPAVHKNGIWFNLDLSSSTEGIIEVTKGVKNSYKKFDKVHTLNMRVSIFDNKYGGTSIYTKGYNIKDGAQVLYRFVSADENTEVFTAGAFIIGKDYEIVEIGTTDFTSIGAASNTIGEIFTATGIGTGSGVALNTSRLRELILEDENNVQTIFTMPNTEAYVVVDTEYAISTGALVGYYYLLSPNYCFGVGIKNIVYKRFDISYDSITFDKVQKYEAACEFEMPIVDGCSAVPYTYGDFGYWESIVDYPDNSELYNSSNLKIREDDFEDLGVRAEFKEKYTQGYDVDYFYDLKPETNFVCKPIRHYKFPDNKVSSFIFNRPISGFTKTIIHPLGVTINETAIVSFLNIAVKNGLITKDQAESVVSYEIFRGDRTQHKSILAKGLLYDMYSYEEDNKDILFANFPYNDLGKNELFYTSEKRNTFINHPFGGVKNSNFMFHSPETDYYKPSVPTQLKVEGYAFGKSKGAFDEVDEHPKYVILGKKAKKLASTLAKAEVLAELAIIAAESANVYRTSGGFTFSANIPGWFLNGAAILANGLAAVVYKYGRYRYEWLQTFRNLGAPENFAYYYASVGNYNYLQPLQEEGNIIRSINKGNYLKSGRYTVANEIEGTKLDINHIDREKGLFLTTGEAFPINYPTEYSSYDNNSVESGISSRFTASQAGVCAKGKSAEEIRNIASPYVAIKINQPAQYGGIDSINWLTTSYIGDIKNPATGCLPIFGGDTYISRHTLKRKMPLFLVTAMGQASRTPYAYKMYSNLGLEPKFYADFYSPSEVTLTRGMPDLDTEYKFDCLTGNRDFYVTAPSKFYLYYYGIVDFLTETTINTNFRIGGPEPKAQFYPLVEDYMNWTQEDRVSIREENIFKYNSTYSNNTRPSIGRNLPYTYSKEVYDTLVDSPNGVFYSLPDNSETDLSEPWLTFRPLDKYEFPTTYGKLIELRGIEDDQVLGRFETTTAIFNAIDLRVDGVGQDAAQLGTGSIFRNRPVTFSSTDLGYGGTQSSSMISCEAGHFFADVKRGQVFNLQGGQKSRSINEISADVEGRGVGMRNWFKENLPFKILNSNIEDRDLIDIDNPLNGIGLTMGWDSRFKRVFLTKKDYIPKVDTLKYVPETGFVDTDVVPTESITCPDGYTYNATSGKCEKAWETAPLCPDGYTYDSLLNECTLIEIVTATCVCTADVIAIGETLCSGGTTSISLSTTSIETITYSWTVVQSGVTGATSGTGNIINQIIANTGIVSGTATYTITPHETGTFTCDGTPIEVVVIVQPVPNVIATPTSLEITEEETAIINLTSDVVGTTFTWTVANTGTTGPVAGSGNLISQVVSGVGTSTYTIIPTANGCVGTPVDVVVNTSILVIDNNTEINIWFDNSGSMKTTMTPLNEMKTDILKACLLPAYNNDSALYDSRVHVYNFDDAESAFDGAADGQEAYIHLMSKPIVGVTATKVINLCFADESSGGGTFGYDAEANWANNISTKADTDISKLRDRLDNVTPNSLIGIVFQVATGGVGAESYPGFRAFVNALHTGVTPFDTTPVTLSDRPEIGYELDVVPGSSATYYANLIITALNNLGFAIPVCTP